MIYQQKIRVLAMTTLFIFMFASMSANAFRCGRKIVLENMHEAQVRQVCGAPTTSRNLGYVQRGSYVPARRRHSPGVSIEHFPGHGYYTVEVVLTEYVYNFGPRKLMRRLLFEGGVLIKIETIGYGYHEKKSK